MGVIDDRVVCSSAIEQRTKKFTPAPTIFNDHIDYLDSDVNTRALNSLVMVFVIKPYREFLITSSKRIVLRRMMRIYENSNASNQPWTE
ncbi:unnamed protein product, partial [Mesorhabditis belari]|uniref:Uncharacterized protein n=1 Tax=Mesorhabditis belari TaxID=2138241 RepID=A0AAF3J799_9BILA